MTPVALLRKLRSARAHLRQTLLSQRFGFSPSTIYDGSFYEGPGCAQGKAHAEAVARVLMDRFAPQSFFDFGCGHGALIGAMQSLGALASGCEGSVHGVERCPAECLVFQADLKRPVHLNRRFDLVTCIEVAEHLPKRSERVLVKSIADAADRRIVFSASGPGQLGDDHINLVPPDYWAGLFKAHGFTHDEAASRQIRREMGDAGAPAWFQNTIVLER